MRVWWRLLRRASKSGLPDLLCLVPISGKPEIGCSSHDIFSSSRKQAVHEPARRHGLARVEALAVEPEAAAGLVLDQVVVARRRRRAAAPPFGGDALRALRLGDAMQHAAPAEAPRRAFGHLRH